MSEEPRRTLDLPEGPVDMAKGNLGIPYPRPDVFKYRKPITAPFREVLAGTNSNFIFDHAEYPDEGGIYLYTKGTLFPNKGFVFPEALYACNSAKRAIRHLLTLFDKRFFWPFVGFLVAPQKRKVAMISALLRVFQQSSLFFLGNFILEEKRYSPSCRELRKLITRFLEVVGITEEVNDPWLIDGKRVDFVATVADKFAEILITLVEFDNAYRWRIQDIMSEASKGRLLADFPKEIARLMEIYGSREGGGKEMFKKAATYQNFKKISQILRVLWWLPSFRRAIRAAVEAADWKALQFDEADIYHSLPFEDYDYRGIPIKERLDIFAEWHVQQGLDLPPRVFYTISQ